MISGCMKKKRLAMIRRNHLDFSGMTKAFDMCIDTPFFFLSLALLRSLLSINRVLVPADLRLPWVLTLLHHPLQTYPSDLLEG